MARSRINSRSKDLISDDGAVLVSLVEGEQIQMDITLSWLTNLTGYTLTAKIVEADMAGAVDEDGYPTGVKAGGVVTTLDILDATVTDNTFKIVIPEDLIDSWTTQPSPEAPTYGWIGLEVRDTGVGNAQLIWKPFRGLVEVLYSPSEEV
jgi:hypothetical protein